MFRGATRRAFRLLPPLHRSSFLLPFRSVRAAAGMPAARPLFRAYRMCARARVRAGAVRAPDCARANQAQGARLLSVPLGFFCAGARRETKQPPDAASFCLILPLISENQVLTQDLFLYCANLSGRIATRASSAMPSPSPAPAAPGKAQPPKAEDVSRHIAICHEMSCFVMRCHEAPCAPGLCQPSVAARGACLPSVSGMALRLLRLPESKRRPRKPPVLYSHLTTASPMSNSRRG